MKVIISKSREFVLSFSLKTNTIPFSQLLKPAFTILVDDKLECILLLIRGTHSVKDTLTAVTGAVVPFHHTVLDEDGVSNIVLGYAHCGMVAAARWMSQLATPVLLQAQKDHPLYTLKVCRQTICLQFFKRHI